MSTQSDIQGYVDATGFYLRGASGAVNVDSGAGGVSFTNVGVTNAAGIVDAAGFNFVRASTQYMHTSSSRAKWTDADDFTLFQWINVPNTAANNPWSPWGSFTGVAAGGGLVGYDLGAFGISGKVYDSSGSTTAGTPVTTLSSATWYWLLFSHKASTKTITMEFNNSTVFSASYSPNTLSASSGDWYLGCIDSSFDFGFNGQMAEVGACKQILTPSEKAYLFNAGAGVNLYGTPVTTGSPWYQYAQAG